MNNEKQEIEKKSKADEFLKALDEKNEKWIEKKFNEFIKVKEVYVLINKLYKMGLVPYDDEIIDVLETFCDLLNKRLRTYVYFE